MSKMTIRNGMFETNSSSVHSICISKKPVENVKGKKIAFYLGEYGWEHETVDTSDYLYTAIMSLSDSEELLDKLKSILDKYEIDYTFQPVEKASHWWGIDHSGETIDFVEAVLEDEDLLLRCLFSGESVVYTGNDNSGGDDLYDGCYIAESEKYDREVHGYVPNPYHDEDKFNYFMKGN